MVFEKKMGLIVASKNFFFDLLDFVFPNFCILCNKKVLRNLFSICDDCLNSLEMSNQKDIDEFYYHNLASYKLIINFYSKYEFVKEGNFQKIIHQLKYNGKSKIGLLLGQELGKELLKHKWFEEIDLVIPVPIHRFKKITKRLQSIIFNCKGYQFNNKKSF